MDNSVMKELLSSYKNFVFIGEAGSGKSEFGINMAMAMADQNEKDIHFFDMDQTKPLFRSRDVSRMMEAKGIKFHSQVQFQDIPTMVSGVVESLDNPNEYTLLDIGGNIHGALMAGQLSRSVNSEKTCVFFLINVYRPWSDNADNIEKTKSSIMAACRVADVRLISNPNLGYTTSAEDVMEGDAELTQILGADNIDFICIKDSLIDSINGIDKKIIPIHQYIEMPKSV